MLFRSAAIAREVEGGLIENVYRLQIMNTTEEARAFEVSVSGIASIRVAGEATVGMPAASSRMVPLKVRIEPERAKPGTHPIEFTVRTIGAGGVAVHEKSVFIVR